MDQRRDRREIRTDNGRPEHMAGGRCHRDRREEEQLAEPADGRAWFAVRESTGQRDDIHGEKGESETHDPVGNVYFHLQIQLVDATH
ncbi:hypothetical protein LFL97_20365 [Burkholderia sp. JSH-S8]|nr:hypothetical protein LFL97_20365 [Burkholderia sp. JSH-S8]